MLERLEEQLLARAELRHARPARREQAPCSGETPFVARFPEYHPRVLGGGLCLADHRVVAIEQSKLADEDPGPGHGLAVAEARAGRDRLGEHALALGERTDVVEGLPQVDLQQETLVLVGNAEVERRAEPRGAFCKRGGRERRPRGSYVVVERALHASQWRGEREVMRELGELPVE